MGLRRASGAPRRRRRGPNRPDRRRSAGPPLVEGLETRLLLAAPPPIIINEIHYDPDVKTQLVEFVELYNAGTASADLSGWRLEDAVWYTFPPGTQLDAGKYLVIGESPSAIQSKFGVAALGPWTGRLDNEGDRVALRDALGQLVDEVDYKCGFPWPTVGDAPGYSMELVNPALDNDLGGSWRQSKPGSVGDPSTLVPERSSWYYRKGTSEASSPTSAWRDRTFSMDGTWTLGGLPIGYGEDFLATKLNDMRYNYSSFFLRKPFEVADPSAIGSPVLEAMYDDGFNAWINGYPVTSQNVSGYEMAYNATAGPAREDANYRTFSLPDPSQYLVAGTNVLAVQLFNANRDSSTDAFFDARLKTTPTSSSAGPTPGRKNAAYAVNIPPQMRQVEHSPEQPAAGQDVTITVKVTDADGVASVSLSYQLVDPGAYIELTDPAYQTNWTAVAMRDDGAGGDDKAGDDIYTAVLPGSLQTNRRLVRYRITATDRVGLSITAPYSDDPVPNFAYFCYDGVPAWSGAIEPGSSDPAKAAVVSYDPSVLTSVPVYHLISKKASVEASNWIERYGGDLYKWSGTLVYDGVVYDHIHYRARGGVWRYAMGKNMWKFDFNRGHSFQAYDNYGRKYDQGWTKLNLSACIQQGDYGHRGEQGMFEAAGFELFNLMGAETSKTYWIHFRVIDEVAEAGPTQYDGDFWGLYLAIEQIDGQFLDEHDLPDGNLYKMEGGTGDLNNQGRTAVTDKSDLNYFLNTLKSSPSDQWWRDNFDLERYYGYRCVVEGIHHYDIDGDPGKNYFYYLNPETNKWQVHPWDLDLTWANSMYGGGNSQFKSRVLPRTAFNIEYRNRMREFRDLLYNAEAMFPLLDELAAIIDDPYGGPSLVDADRAMWDYNPIMISSYVNSSKAGKGRFYQIASTKDFPGMVQLMKNYVISRGSWLDTNFANDAEIPSTPTITYVGPADYPVNRLRFGSSAFSDSTGTFAAMEWRLAEVTDPAAPAYDPAEPLKQEITAAWESGEITAFAGEIGIPGEAVEPGHAYRVRVRMKDSTGRWSHWSAPIQFIATPATPTDLLNWLRVTEIMYNPADSPPGGPYDHDQFEFIEVRNIGDQAIDLSGVSFTKGIKFPFAGSAVTSLAPGEYAVVVRNLEAFSSRYDTTGMRIAGEFFEDSSLANGGERIVLADAHDGTILDFTYDDDWYDITDGGGYSLRILDERADRSLWGSRGNWQPSQLAGGTPGAGDEGILTGSVVISEVLAHTDEPAGDWIELFNTTDRRIDIGGWFLSDDGSDLAKFQIPADTWLEGGQRLVFCQATDFGPAAIPNGFGLSELGDEVFLCSGIDGQVGGYREHVDFGASPREMSLGLYTKSTGATDFTLLSSASPGQDNAYPWVGPLVINEIMYNPPPPAPGSPFTSDDFEYVELLNASNETLDLRSFYIAEGLGFTFGWYGTDTFGGAVWTLESGATATWTASLPVAGTYEVLVYVSSADGLGGTVELDPVAQYSLSNLGGPASVVLDQDARAGQWASLGSFSFAAGAASVTLARGAAGADERTIADRVKFVKPGTEIVVDNSDAAFSTTGCALTSLGAGQYVVMVRNLEAFDQRYDIVGNGIPVAGVFSGGLDSEGEAVRLYQAGTPELSGYIPYVRIDRVSYRDEAPWPADADGGGASLSRQVPQQYGNDPDNWAPSIPNGTPGSRNLHLDLSPPTAPADLAATAVSRSRIDLAWQAAVDPQSGVDHYVVYRDNVAIAAMTSTSYSDAGRTETATYCYEVSAVNPSGGEGPRSAKVNATPRPSLQAAKMDDPSHVTVTFGKALLRASAEAPVNYTITDGGGAAVPVAGAALLADPTKVRLSLDSPLTAGVTYTLAVQGVTDLAGNPVEDGSSIPLFFRDTIQDLLAWWTFDEGSSTAAVDASGNGRTLSFVGAALDSNGRIGPALRLDGADDYALDDDGEEYINGLTAFTVAMWIKADAIGTDRGIFTTRDPGSVDCPSLRYDETGWSGGAKNTFKGYLSTTAGDRQIEGAAYTQTTDWQHVAVTWASGGEMILYVNGIAQALTQNQGAIAGAVNSATKVHIGQGDRAGYFWQGLIDDIRIYSRQLSAWDVGLLVNLDPVSRQDDYEVDAGQSLALDAAFGVLANDSDADGPQPLTAALVSDAAHGQLTLHGDGSFEYAPSPGYEGPDGFTYRAYDGLEYGPATTVSITVNSVAPPQVAEFIRNGGLIRPGELSQVAIRFSRSVAGSLDAGDLRIRSDATGKDVDLAAAIFQYDAQTDTGCWDLHALGIGPGRYTVILTAAGVTGPGGIPLDGDGDGVGGDDYQAAATVYLGGDTDLDGDVDFLDFLTVKGSFGATDATWATGDSDGDGDVDFTDYLAAKGNFGQSLAAAEPEILPAATGALAVQEAPGQAGTGATAGSLAEAQAVQPGSGLVAPVTWGQSARPADALSPASGLNCAQTIAAAEPAVFDVQSWASPGVADLADALAACEPADVPYPPDMPPAEDTRGPRADLDDVLAIPDLTVLNVS